MRQPSILVLLISLIIIGTVLPTFSAVKGGVEYSIPVDYSKLNENDTEKIARVYFFNAEKLKDEFYDEVIDIYKDYINDKAKVIINELKAKYVKRPAFIDELSKIKL